MQSHRGKHPNFPKEESDGLSAIIRDFKKYTANQIIKFVETSNSESRRDWLLLVFRYHAKFNKNNVKYQVWQQDNRPKEMLHPKFIMQKINYIHNNPVASHIVSKPEDYVHSSARNYIGSDGCVINVEVIDFGSQAGYVMT